MMHYRIVIAAIGVNAQTDDNPIHVIKQIIQNSDINTTTVEQYERLYNSLINYQEGLGEFFSAIATVDAAILTLQTKRADHDHLAEFHLRKAALHLKNGDVGDVEDAISDYAHAIRLDQQNVNLDFEQELMEVMPVGTSDRAGEDSDDTESLFARALTQDLLGRKCWEGGKPAPAKRAFTAAIHDYTQLLDHHDLDPVLLRDRRGQLYLSVVDMPEKARQDFDALVNKNPNRADYRYHRALSLLALKFYEEALSEFKESIALAPPSHPIARLSHDRAAYISLLYEEYETAITHWKSAIQTADHPDDLSLKVRLALAFYRDQNYVQSIRELTEVEAALDTLDATQQQRLHRDIARLRVRMPNQENQADPTETEVKNRQDWFREVVQLTDTDIKNLDVDEQNEICASGFWVVEKRLKLEAA